MDIEVKMPDLSTTGSQVTLVDWLVDEGDAVTRGQGIVAIETDKATMEVEALASGRLKTILARPRQAVEAGQVIAVIETADTPTAKPPPGREERPRGMFSRNRTAAARKSTLLAVNASTSVALSPTQQTTGRRLSASKQSIPHFYLETSFAAGPAADHRHATSPQPAWDAYFVAAVGHALRAFHRFAHRFADGRLTPSGTDAVGVAVDLDGDLYVLGIDRPTGKSVSEISADIRRGVARLQTGDAGARRLPTVNLTISNLGAANVERFTAVINPPESAVLAIGRLAEVPAVIEGKLQVALRGNLTLSVDHRVANGRYAAGFLGAIVDALEHPGAKDC